jgi:L-cysteine/cystine lyase
VHQLRAEFPILERLAYLNAGTNGPVPRAAGEAVEADLARQLETGRGDKAFFEESVIRRLVELRRRVAALLGCETAELALTGSTTAGVNAAVSMLDLRSGDEVLTSDEEHPGVLAPLAATSKRRRVDVRTVPFEELPGEVGPRTRLVVASHVSWVTGRVLDAVAIEAPLLLDGAQGLGAVPVDVRALGCDFYAASGQKWLCGPNGLGYLYVRKQLIGELVPPWPGYGSLADVERPLDLALHEDARRFDAGLVAPHQAAWALAALDTLERPGLSQVQARARELAGELASGFKDRGLTVAPRGESPLVSWESADPETDSTRLRENGIVVRYIPGRRYVRASVGGWSSEEELERLLATC